MQQSQLYPTHTALIIYPAFGHFLPILEWIRYTISSSSHTHYFHVVTSKTFLDQLYDRQVFHGLPIQPYTDSSDNKTDFSHQSCIVLHALNDGNGTAEALATEASFMNMVQPVKEFFDKTRVQWDTVFIEMFACKVIEAWMGNMAMFKQQLPKACQLHLFCPSSLNSVYHMLCYTQGIHPTTNALLQDSDTDIRVYPHSERLLIRNVVTAFVTSIQHVDQLYINTFYELESCVLDKWNQLFTSTTPIIRCVGPTLLLNTPVHSLKTQAIEFLDNQPMQSVIYMSMGSIGQLSAPQIQDVFEALVQLGHPFLWSLRAQQYELLTQAHVDHVQTKYPHHPPFLILDWVKQPLSILKHPSTLLFITHCGWNATLEAISSGVPIVGWPLFAEQHMNASLLESLGLGRVLDTRLHGQHVTIEHIVQACSSVMKNQEIKTACKQMQFKAIQSIS